MATFGNVEQVFKRPCEGIQILVQGDNITAAGQAGSDAILWYSGAPGKWTERVMSGMASDSQICLSEGKPLFVGNSDKGLQYAKVDEVTGEWSDLAPVTTASAADFEAFKLVSNYADSAQLLGLRRGNFIAVDDNNSGVPMEREIATGLPEHEFLMDAAICQSGKRVVAFSDGKQVWASTASTAGAYELPSLLADYTGEVGKVDLVKATVTPQETVVTCWVKSESTQKTESGTPTQTITFARADDIFGSALTKERALCTVEGVKQGSVELHTDRSGAVRAFWIDANTAYPMTVGRGLLGKWTRPEIVAPVAAGMITSALNANGYALAFADQKTGALHAVTFSGVEKGGVVQPYGFSVEPSGYLAISIDRDGNFALARADSKGVQVVRGSL